MNVTEKQNCIVVADTIVCVLSFCAVAVGSPESRELTRQGAADASAGVAAVETG